MKNEHSLNLQYFTSLDGLRGLAALAVFLSHAFGIYNPGSFIEIINNTPLHILWDGAAAVVLFFILSGFVVSIPFVGTTTPRPLDFIPFVIRRIIRLYIPYLAAFILALSLRYLVFQSGGLDGLSPWIAAKWAMEPNWPDIIKHALIINSSNSTVSVMWAMIHLIRISIIFPFVILLLKKINSPIRIIFFVLVVYSISLVGQLCELGIQSSILTSLLTTLVYFHLFAMGGLLAKYRFSIIKRIQRLPISTHFIIFILAIITYNIRFSIPGISNVQVFGYHIFSGHNIFVDFISGLGSAAIIILAMSNNYVSNFLSFRLLAYLGKISYSFYLLHFPILLAT